MTNQRLRGRLVAADMSSADLAEAVGVDPKTIERWIHKDRVPHPRHRIRAAQELGVEPADLWPESVIDDRSHAELVGFYPSRTQVPDSLWRRLVDQVQMHLDVLVYSGLFFLDNYADLSDLLPQRRGSLSVRFLIGRPGSDAVSNRGAAEGIGDSLSARAQLSLDQLAGLEDAEALEVRLHESALYNSMYRFDDDLLVNTHVLGSQAPNNPVLHLRRTAAGCLFDHYMDSFETVWSSASPGT